MIAFPALAPAPARPPVATDVTVLDIERSGDALPRGGASDRPIRSVDVTDDDRYMLDGAGTLVDPNDAGMRGSAIQGGVTPRAARGEVIIIPRHTPHWWSEIESDLEYPSFRPDSDNRPELR